LPVDFDVFVRIFHLQLLWELNRRSLEFKACAKLGKKKKGGCSKTSKEGTWFCPTKVPPFFLVFLFLSFSTSPSLPYVPFVAIVQVMTRAPTHCHIAIACIGYGHQEEKGEQGGSLPPRVGGVVVALPCS
jgi:hypothetical protein